MKATRRDNRESRCAIYRCSTIPVVTDGDAVGGGKTIKSKPLAWLDHDRAIGETTTIPTPHSDALRLGFVSAVLEWKGARDVLRRTSRKESGDALSRVGRQARGSPCESRECLERVRGIMLRTSFEENDFGDTVFYYECAKCGNSIKKTMKRRAPR